MEIWTVTSTNRNGSGEFLNTVEVTRHREGSYTSNLEPDCSCSCAEQAAFFPFLMRDLLPSAANVEGKVVDLIRVRYTSGGLSTISSPITLGEIRSERLGIKADGGRTLNGTFQTAVDHFREVASCNREKLEDGYRERATNASYRATLAIMKIFGFSRIRKHVKEKSALESGLTVEISLNGGPWSVVDGSGSSNI